MNHCCSHEKAEDSFPRKHTCPVNQQDYIYVPIKTILHHIKDSWKTNITQQGYYFCNDPDCEVVYFGEDGTQIIKSELRTKVFVKNKEDALICYCFGISLKDASSKPSIKDFVIQQTKQGNCSCETSNPSGRCCLKDFP